MKIIVGLGNPGDKYLLTRHNVGFLFVDFLQQKFGFDSFSENSKLKAFITDLTVDGEKFILVKPTTFMNLSGESLVAIKSFYKEVEWSDFLICYDDVDLMYGMSRFRESGSAGTHNGMRSIIELSGQDAIPRLRFGVDLEGRKGDLSGFVLGKLTVAEQEALTGIFEDGLKLLEKTEFALHLG